MFIPYIIIDLTYYQLRKSYHVVVGLKKLSGFVWDDSKSLNITINEALAWEEYVVVRV